MLAYDFIRKCSHLLYTKRFECIYYVTHLSSSYAAEAICFASVYHTIMDRLSTVPTQTLIRHSVFSQTGPPGRVDCLARFKSIGVKNLSQGHNDPLSRNRTASRQHCGCQLTFLSTDLYHR